MPRNLQAERRRAQTAEAWRNLAREVEAMMATMNISREDAMMAVFNDPQALARCHQVTPAGEINLGPLDSPIKVQNE
jgi:hypothetical protein